MHRTAGSAKYRGLDALAGRINMLPSPPEASATPEAGETRVQVHMEHAKPRHRTAAASSYSQASMQSQQRSRCTHEWTASLQSKLMLCMLYMHATVSATVLRMCRGTKGHLHLQQRAAVRQQCPLQLNFEVMKCIKHTTCTERNMYSTSHSEPVQWLARHLPSGSYHDHRE
jgi:hypothetical protein